MEKSLIGKHIKKLTGASSIQEQETIQKLWSGYGEIVRYALEGGSRNSVVIKHVRLSKRDNHPRGWNSNLSHQRKLKSYEVEVHWYQHYARETDMNCRMPECLGVRQEQGDILIVLEDLDDAKYTLRKSNPNINEMMKCIEWLANFHAKFLNTNPKGLWEKGTYWHLDTRPEELEVLDDLALKVVAPKIDQVLNEAKFKTLVHGDAKVANFCFAADGDVAAVDFQYIGGGCGMKDLVYFVGSCLHEEDCERYEKKLVNHYFLVFGLALEKRKLSGLEIEKEWRELFSVAWADFHRFLKGWSPGHWKINSYSEKITKEVIKKLS